MKCNHCRSTQAKEYIISGEGSDRDRHINLCKSCLRMLRGIIAAPIYEKSKLNSDPSEYLRRNWKQWRKAVFSEIMDCYNLDIVEVNGVPF
jgi:hypothetical protein